MAPLWLSVPVDAILETFRDVYRKHQHINRAFFLEISKKS